MTLHQHELLCHSIHCQSSQDRERGSLSYDKDEIIRRYSVYILLLSINTNITTIIFLRYFFFPSIFSIISIDPLSLRPFHIQELLIMARAVWRARVTIYHEVSRKLLHPPCHLPMPNLENLHLPNLVNVCQKLWKITMFNG